MTHFITTAQAVRIAELATGGPVDVRDMGLLESAVLRPQTAAFGEEAYPDLLTKAAALLQSLGRNHPLVDGNKRLAWLAMWVFCAKNEVVLAPEEDVAYEFMIEVATGRLEEVAVIAERLGSFVEGA